MPDKFKASSGPVIMCDKKRGVNKMKGNFMKKEDILALANRNYDWQAIAGYLLEKFDWIEVFLPELETFCRTVEMIDPGTTESMEIYRAIFQWHEIEQMYSQKKKEE